jgi:hypothetical protein
MPALDARAQYRVRLHIEAIKREAAWIAAHQTTSIENGIAATIMSSIAVLEEALQPVLK